MQHSPHRIAVAVGRLFAGRPSQSQSQSDDCSRKPRFRPTHYTSHNLSFRASRPTATPAEVFRNNSTIGQLNGCRSACSVQNRWRCWMPMPRMVDECATCATGCALAGVPGAGVGSSRLVSEKKSTLTFFAGPKPEPGLDHLHPHHRHNPVAQWRQRSDETGDGRLALQYAYVQVRTVLCSQRRYQRGEQAEG